MLDCKKNKFNFRHAVIAINKTCNLENIIKFTFSQKNYAVWGGGGSLKVSTLIYGSVQATGGQKLPRIRLRSLWTTPYQNGEKILENHVIFLILSRHDLFKNPQSPS